MECNKEKIVAGDGCPCKKIKCSHHGKCRECREAHKNSTRPRPCER